MKETILFYWLLFYVFTSNLIGNEEIGGAIRLEKNSLWEKVDVDYTPFTNILSAVWPTLRYYLTTTCTNKKDVSLEMKRSFFRCRLFRCMLPSRRLETTGVHVLRTRFYLNKHLLQKKWWTGAIIGIASPAPFFKKSYSSVIDSPVIYEWVIASRDGKFLWLSASIHRVFNIIWRKET